MILKIILRRILLWLSKFLLKNDFFSVEGQYELEGRLRKSKMLRQIVLKIAKVAGKKQSYYSILKIDAEQRFLALQNDNKVVQRGPFKGMVYPSLASYSSVLAAKLLGSYEEELDNVIEKTLQKPYRHILDIGCAEGYYAVGYAMKKQTAKIHAFDINQTTLALCKKMAILNKVEEKFIFYEECTPELLKTFDFSESALIMSDCEGYENDLFSPTTIPNLLNCDVLIELHDHVHPDILEKLSTCFASSHSVQIIEGTIRNPSLYPELQPFSDLEKNLILYELRNEFEEYMQGKNPGKWLFAKSLSVAK